MPRPRRTGALAAFAAVPAIALTAAFTPCLCPAHKADHAMAVAATSHDLHAAHDAHAVSDAHAAQSAQVSNSAGPTALAQPAGSGRPHLAGPGALRSMAWVVGTPQVPLVLRQDAGALALGEAPREPAAIRATAARAGAGDAPVAARTELTTAQATAKLSRRCRKLLRAKRPSRLRASDRRKRSACLRQRRQLIAASMAPADAPTATPAPTDTTPAATTPAATPTPAPMPTPAATPAPCATPCVRAIGVQARDQGGVFIFTLTRAAVEADRVSFQFENKDAQDHNLFVQPKGRPDLAVPISTLLEPGGRVTKELDLAPGTYTLRCVILGHESMTVDITVTAPAR